MELELYKKASKILFGIELEEGNVNKLRKAENGSYYNAVVNIVGQSGSENVIRLTNEEESYILKYLINKKEKEIEELKKEFKEL